MSKGIIGTVLQGGLGNVMFQIANIEYLGMKYDMDVIYMNPQDWIDKSVNHPELGWSPNAGKISEIFPNVDIFKNQERRLEMEKQVNCSFRYHEIIPKDKFIYHGYFQSEKFFPDKDFIRHLFIFGATVAHPFDINDDCSVHVRRGDYLRQQNYHPVLEMDYYNDAMYIQNEVVGIERYYIFSNDNEWVSQNFKGDEFHIVTSADYESLYFMSTREHHIIANSSFSWWGAWLGEGNFSSIVSPIRWFGDALPYAESHDIIPDRWIRV